MHATTDELLYESVRTRVTRRLAPDGSSIILKKAMHPDAVQLLRHERSVLERVAGVDGTVKLAAGDWPLDVLALQDDGGTPLNKLIDVAPFDVDEALRLALRLSRILASVHRSGVMHKDITPSNIVLCGPERRPVLIDFNIAAALSEEHASFQHQMRIAGTMAYMPPEQTGRTGQPIDHRSDLYALGAVLFHLIAGRPVFESDDLLELLRNQLTATPPRLADLAPQVPHTLSAMVERLLEKDPDRRYQSADGLAHDLHRLIQSRSVGTDERFELGERDFAAKLRPPSRLVGRERERAVLRAGLHGASAGSGVCLLIAGQSGAGKTALVNELKGELATTGGWFVSGQGDQHRQHGESQMTQALRTLGRLLLSEPEESLARFRERIAAALGQNISAGIARIPEFELLLGQQPFKVIDPIEAERKLIQGVIETLGSVASRERPLVMALDDMQWANDTLVRLVDGVIAARAALPGLLLVLAYRPEEVSPQSLLHTRMQHWQRGESPPHQLALGELAPSDLGELVGEMLRLAPEPARRLGDLLGERSRGNPQDTIELINALRADGLLEPGTMGWHWDAPGISRYVGDHEGVDLLARRIDKLPPACLGMLQILACLGHEVPSALIEAVRDPAATDTLALLAPALDEGLLVAERRPEGTQLRWRNNRVLEYVRGVLHAGGHAVGVRLGIARRLAIHPWFVQHAAQQYLDVLDHIDDASERRSAAALLHTAATQTMVVNTPACERFLEAAIRALTPIETPTEAPLLLNLLIQRHLALYGLARQDEGDAVYAAIAARCETPAILAVPAGVQVHSLTNRLRYPDALALGLQVLAGMGLHAPSDVAPIVEQGMRGLAAWAIGEDKHADLHRPEAADEQLKSLALLLKRSLGPAFSIARPMYAWLLIQAHRLWVEHGPCAELMTSVASIPLMLAGKHENYRAAYSLSRHMIDVGRTRGYNPGTSMAQTIAGLCATHWGEPLEENLVNSRNARAGLVKANDTLYAAYTFNFETMALIETAPNIEEVDANVEAALGFQAKTGSVATTGITLAYKQWLRTLRGQTARLGDFEEAEFSENAFVERHGKMPAVPIMLYLLRAQAATLFNDHATRRRCLDAAGKNLQPLSGAYILTLYELLNGLAWAEELRSSSEPSLRQNALGRLDEHLAWMRARAADAPANFAHLERLLLAERAWALGALDEAAAEFDIALAKMEVSQRPWHRALTLERNARLLLARGWAHTAKPLLVETLRSYEEWGASAKVTALQVEFPFLRQLDASRGKRLAAPDSLISTDSVDVMAILRASQLLSSETSLSQLNASVASVLSALCGAEKVLLVWRSPETRGWFVATSPESGAEPVPLEQAAAGGALALSAFRYAERTREPLLVADAMNDHRFAADPALAGLARCSLLLVPILKQGELHAMLVLESRTRQGAFSVDRLQAVRLIAGQLAVSLDNALLYASLERKVADRTLELEQSNRQLELLSVTDSLTGLPNRRHFNQMLAAEWSRAARSGLPVGIAMIDIDQFKKYNDHYGHQGGDECLKLVADTMRAELRAGVDMIARYGGEEFVLLLCDSDLDATRAAAERIRAAVAARMEPHATSLHGMVTVSVGIDSAVPAHGSDPGPLIAAADAALYRAKSDGRNRVVGTRPGAAGTARDAPARRKADLGTAAPTNTQRLSVAAQLNELGFLRWQRGQTHLHVSSPLRASLGWAEDDKLTVRALMRAIEPSSWAALAATCKQAARRHQPHVRAELRLRNAGQRMTVNVALELAYEDGGALSDIVAAAQNTSQQTELLAELSESKQRLSEAYELSSAAYWEWDFATRQAKFSSGALRLLGRPEGWQATWEDIKNLTPIDQRKWVHSLYTEAFEKKLPSIRYELNYPQPGGALVHLHTVAKLEYDKQGKLARIISNFQDVSELKTYRRQLRSLSFYDTLTDLPNRTLFLDRLRESCAAAMAQQQTIGLLMLDLDRFKQINDSMGHSAGDALLCQAAERLNQLLGAQDVVARMSGDEFAVLLSDLQQTSDMNAIAQKMLGAFAMPFTVLGKEVFISASIGGALFPSHAKDVDQLLQFADAALYHAKAQGRNNFQLYESKLTDQAVERLALERELRRGLERGELELYYQPKFDLASGKLKGAEALMRWNHPQRGLVPPQEFISLAEDTGLIVPMGAWALEAACRCAAQWNAGRSDPLKIAVNLSPRQLSGGQMASTVRNALLATGCQPQWLELEITESLLLEGRNDVQAELDDIAALGITIAIDDFGTGYSALSYLTRFPISVLKIDRAFIRQVPGDRSGMELVRAIVTLGHSLNMELVAEGVETHEQADYLRELGCELVQGYLFGKPMPQAQFAGLLG